MAKDLNLFGRGPQNHKRKGFAGEDRACEELIRMGFKIVARNFKGPYGEVDIILEHKDELVFVEVKCWDSFRKADLEYAIDARKRSRIIKTSLYFLEKNREYQEYSLRYDVFFLTGKSEKYYIQNAFEGDGTPI